MRQIRFSETVGKLVTAVEGDDYTGYIVVFNGGTYCVLMATQEYDCVYLRDDPRTARELCMEFGESTVIRLGIASEADIRAEAEREAAKQRTRQERAERAQWERLRAKYGQ